TRFAVPGALWVVRTILVRLHASRFLGRYGLYEPCWFGYTLRGSWGVMGCTNHAGSATRFAVPGALWVVRTLQVRLHASRFLGRYGLYEPCRFGYTLRGSWGVMGCTNLAGSATRFAVPGALWVVRTLQVRLHASRFLGRYRLYEPCRFGYTLRGSWGVIGCTNHSGSATRFAVPGALWVV